MNPFNRRKHERFSAEGRLQCPFGDVVDLSESGMKVRCHGWRPPKTGAPMSFVICFQGGRLSVEGRIVRVKRRGLKTFEAGIEFTTANDQKRKALGVLAKYGFIGSSTRDKINHATAQRLYASLPDYYRTLGVRRGARIDEIRAAFRKLSFKYHPDTSGDQSTAEKFNDICEAYNTLKDDKSRAEYDEMLRRSQAAA